MEDFSNNAIRDLAVQCAAQSAKTQTVMNCACWAIAEDPGPAMWVTATKDELRDFMRDRLTPTFETCRPVKERMGEPASGPGEVAIIPFFRDIADKDDETSFHKVSHGPWTIRTYAKVKAQGIQCLGKPPQWSCETTRVNQRGRFRLKAA